MYYYWPSYILWLLTNYRKQFFLPIDAYKPDRSKMKQNKQKNRQTNKQTNKINQKKKKNQEKELCPYQS